MFDRIFKKITKPQPYVDQTSTDNQFFDKEQLEPSSNDNSLHLNYWNNTNDLVWMPKAIPLRGSRAELIPEVLEWIAENMPGTKVEKSPIWNLGVDITFVDHRDMIAFMLRWL